MPVFQTLYYAYKEEGLTPLTGYNPWHFYNYRDAPFTAFLTASGEIKGHDRGGLALQEVMVLEQLAQVIAADNCLVIGNAYGWSTVATALAFPGAKTVGMDIEDADGGLALTNRILERLGLDAKAVLGESPSDLPAVCATHLDGPLDFVLIDGDHSDDGIVADFKAARALAAETCIFLLHDILNFDMVPGFLRILEESGLDGRILTKTPSGMAVVYDPETIGEEPEKLIGVFADDVKIFDAYRKLAEQSFGGDGGSGAGE